MPVTINGSGPITGLTSINTTVSDTELGYLDGVTSALQTQINAKANDSSQGLYLITPTSIANSSGSASASGGKVTFSAVSTVSLNGVFTSTYDNYRILVRLIGSTTALPSLRLRVSGSDATGANYEWQYLQGSGTTVSTARTTGATSLEVSSVGSTDYGLLTLDAASPAVADTTQFSMVATQFTSLIINGSYSGRHTLSTAYDGFTLLANTGTVTGVVRVYGYKNS